MKKISFAIRSGAALMAFAGAGHLGGAEGLAWMGSARAQGTEPIACSDAMPANTKRCRIEVAASPNGSGGCNVTVAPAELTLQGQRNLTIVWRLNANSGDYVFCRTLGDGVFLKYPVRAKDKQVDKMRVSKDPAEDDTVASPSELECRPRFRWKFENHLTTGLQQYDYILRFRDWQANAVCTVDPWIKNGGSSFER